MKIKKNKLEIYAEYINIYIYLIKVFNLSSLSKLTYTAVFLNYCKTINCTTKKRFDVISFYFEQIKMSNVLTYDNVFNAIESMKILIENKVFLIEGGKVKIVDSNIEHIKDSTLEGNSIKLFIEEIKKLSDKSFIREVVSCV